jgi:hypothetical protein
MKRAGFVPSSWSYPFIQDFFISKQSEPKLQQVSEQSKSIAATHNLEAHQLLLVGIVGTFATLITFVFCTFVQAVSFGLLSSIFTYSLILSFMEREDHSTWKSVNHWDEDKQTSSSSHEALDIPADGAADINMGQSYAEMSQAQ